MDKKRLFTPFLPAWIILAALCLPLDLTGGDDGGGIKQGLSGRDGTLDLIKGDGLTVGFCSAAENGESEVATYVGFLFSRIERVGTKSEGPEYYLRTDGGEEIHLFKNATLWREDPVLQGYVNKRVSISGDLYEKELFYKEVKPIIE
ncbi:MAG: hypothetical protein JW984_12655 [Deltaproteobacteria bacterium]|uniref:Uncharacterized protein n=1 Tax=Candidatus Zymogenus saltonus TaxID=2844893 RepID=A0A9D8PP72_9DELT|nr:hypothetical protein [Candidatus Zymogenus saltonus]